MNKTATKTAVVTGSGSGVGRAAALALIHDGYDVVLAGRNEANLRATATQASGPGTAAVVPTDVRQQQSIQRLFDRTAERFDRLDLLFNNAGMTGAGKPVEDVPEDEWTATVETNLTGSFLCAQAAFRIMMHQEPRGGRIINNGSLSAHVPRPHAIAYTATKHAITGLTKALALEGRQYDIACGQIDIGNASTAITTEMSAGTLQADGRVAAEPTIDVDDVARTVVHMANLPPDANIPFLTIMANTMPFLGRG